MDILGWNKSMKLSLGRIELDTNGTINDILEIFSAMRFGIEVSKLHICSCVHNLKWFSEMKFMEISD